MRRPPLFVILALAISACATTSPSASPSVEPGASHPATSASPSESATPAGLLGDPIALVPGSQALDGSYISAVRATGRGFMALGVIPVEPVAVPLLLRGSADGSSWTQLDASPIGSPIDVAGNAAASVMISTGDGSTTSAWRVWYSTDDATWQREEAWTSSEVSWLHSVAAGPGGFAIIGEIGTGEPVAHAVWTSRDGLSWTQHSVESETASLEAVPLADSVLLVTTANSGEEKRLVSVPYDVGDAVDQALPGGGSAILHVLPVGNRLVAITCGFDSGTIAGPPCPVEGSLGVWGANVPSSVDAQLVWESLDDVTGRLEGQALSAAVTNGRRVTILGWDLSSREGRAWVTDDGQHWNDAALSGLSGGVPANVAAGSEVMVADVIGGSTLAGSARQLARSTDGPSWQQMAVLPPPPAVAAGACPAAPTTFAELQAIGFPKAASCFGSQPLTIPAFASDCGGCGGVPATRADPAWINAPFVPWFISGVPSLDGLQPSLGLWPDPDAGLDPLPATGTPITVTGHFNDPVSTSCRTIPLWHGLELEPAATSEAECRASFVVTAVAVR